MPDKPEQPGKVIQMPNLLGRFARWLHNYATAADLRAVAATREVNCKGVDTGMTREQFAEVFGIFKPQQVRELYVLSDQKPPTTPEEWAKAVAETKAARKELEETFG